MVKKMKKYLKCIYLLLILTSCQAKTVANLKKAKVYYHYQTIAPYLSITFDDGPNRIQTPKVLKILKKYNIKKIIVNTYQSVSGSGKKGIDDLIRCRKGLMPIFYQSDISFTCIPLIGKENINHISTEEEKIMNEYKKILNNSNIEIYATCVRVPVMFSHGVSCQIEFSNDFDINDIIKDLENIPNVVYCDNIVPTSILSCKNYKIYIGRLRKQNNNLLFYCVADNVRVGAANNSYLLLTKLIELEEENERKSKEN